MSGEIGLAIKKVGFDEDMVCPYGSPSCGSKPSTTLQCMGEDGEFLYIIGDNDWGYLLADALKDLMQYATSIEDRIAKKAWDYTGKPEFIALGKNEYRALDIKRQIDGKKCLEMFDIPIVKTSKDNGIELFGQSEAKV